MLDSEEIRSDTNSVSSDYQSAQGELTVTLLGKTKTLAGLDRTEWIFFIICVPCLVAAIALTVIYILWKLDLNSPNYIFAILLLVNAAFCLFYTIHGVLREREFELYCLILAILIVTVYVIVNFGLTYPKSKSKIKLARFVVVVVLAPVIIGFAWVVGRGFGYLLFKTVGAKTEIQDMYRIASRFSGLLKIDYQLSIILLILTIEDAGKMSYFSKCCLAVGVPFQLLASLVGWIAMRSEQLLLVWFFLPLCCAEPVFIVHRFIQFSSRWEHYTSNEMEKLTYSFIAAAIGALFIRFLLLLALYVVVKNFGRGLKFKVFQVPLNANDPSIMPSKRQIKRCCGMVCCGPFG
ncbi:uncharacterized protein LOC114521671 [Dendronephthya gigantea]|uniref:uncharacterized protein LOC114521671 n=1 Tax=Dendronephthya gigantea TaxID=151771 RepID=UPI001069E2CF|nr:uncharacterized protein LOC114521671 [Dendronephthya gigantea]XP_028397970.1 uncharacterized protein LOC114521671 [Dendronephthya gigantea]XP_028397971.1 uncharacterized protein LOC114521671 [Dendronephthya gigantea]